MVAHKDDVLKGILPVKSAARYEKHFEKFVEWLESPDIGESRHHVSDLQISAYASVLKSRDKNIKTTIDGKISAIKAILISKGLLQLGTTLPMTYALTRKMDKDHVPKQATVRLCASQKNWSNMIYRNFWCHKSEIFFSAHPKLSMLAL